MVRSAAGRGSASRAAQPATGLAFAAPISRCPIFGALATAIAYLADGCAMATARARSSARNGASRLATTVARELELLATRRERLREREQALRAQLDALADRLGELDSRRRDLDRLLGEEPAAPAAAPPRLIGGAALRRHAVAHLLTCGQHRDIHYRAWYEQLAADGLSPRGRSRRDLPDQRRTLAADRARRTTRDLPARSARRRTHRDAARQRAQSPAPHDRHRRRPG